MYVQEAEKRNSHVVDDLRQLKYLSDASQSVSPSLCLSVCLSTSVCLYVCMSLCLFLQCVNYWNADCAEYYDVVIALGDAGWM